MKKYKKYTLRLSLLILATSILIILFNFLIDATGVFNSPRIAYINANKTQIDNYQRLWKYYQLRRDKEKYQSFIVGTSRTLPFATEDLEKYTHDNVYNISLSASTPFEQMMYVKYIINNFKHINYMVLSLDLFSYNPLTKSTADFNLNRILYNDYVPDYKNLLLTLDALRLNYRTLVDNLEGKSYLYEQNGSYKNMKEYFKSKPIDIIHFNNTLKGFMNAQTLYNSRNFQDIHSIDKQLTYFTSMVNSIKAHHIKLKIFIPPISYEQREAIRAMKLENTYQYLINEVVKEAGLLYDFNYRNKITINKNNFIDSSHVKPNIAPLIFQQLFHYKESDNFGIIRKKVTE